MLAYKDMTCGEGIVAIHEALSRLTVLRPLLDTPPIRALGALADTLDRGDLSQAAERYHALTAALLEANCRRVSGDLFCDFLLHILLEQPNSFSQKAAAGQWEEPLSAAMRYDLTHISRLSQLNSVTLKRWIGERLRELRSKPRQNRDAISTLSSAVWSGGASRPLPRPGDTEVAPATPALPASLDENEWLSWRYVADGLPGSYVADQALEEMYHRLLHTQDWGLLLDDIWNFHNTYGAGSSFLACRVFRLEETGALAGLPADALPQEDAITLYDQERELIVKNVIRFMQGERAQNMLITGASGTGKTTQMLSLTRELPEVRLVLAEGVGPAAIAGVLPQLCAQPFRFLIFLDDLDLQAASFPALRATLRRGGLQPDNVLVIAAAKKGFDPFFPLTVTLKDPQIKDFIDLVQQLLLREGLDVDFESIQNACIDRAAAGQPLSFHAAYAIVDAFLENH